MEYEVTDPQLFAERVKELRGGNPTGGTSPRKEPGPDWVCGSIRIIGNPQYLYDVIAVGCFLKDTFEKSHGFRFIAIPR